MMIILLILILIFHLLILTLAPLREMFDSELPLEADWII